MAKSVVQTPCSHWACVLSHVWLFATPWTVACQTPLSMGFSRQEYWSRLPFPPPEDLPDPWIKHKSPVSLALAGGFFSTVPPGKPYKDVRHHLICNSQNPKPPKCPVIKKSDRATEPGKPTWFILSHIPYPSWDQICQLDLQNIFRIQPVFPPPSPPCWFRSWSSFLWIIAISFQLLFWPCSRTLLVSSKQGDLDKTWFLD